MALELAGRKLGMTQIFDESGQRISVTVLRVGPCAVIQKKTEEKDGYSALQLGFEERKPKHTSRPLQGHFERAGTSARRLLFEVRVDPERLAAYELGQEVDCSEFSVGQRVDVTARSKGRGFSGVHRRWGFKTHTATHGTHEYFRHGGAISAGSYPGKVLKGKRMAGQHGNSQVTIQDLRVVRIDSERHLLFLRGAVPGHTDAFVRVRPARRHQA
ncbi:MAG: 50S ribosomal protein L3 [Myxococcota bacterium]